MKVVGLAALLLWAAPITLTSPDHFAFAPATVRVTIRVEPNETNRLVCLEYDGGQWARSCWDHVGADAPLSYRRELRNLPAGEYVAAATVVRADRSYNTATVEFNILESIPK